MASGISTVFPHYCSVSLSQNTHGEFTIQFYDAAKALESGGITVGSRVIVATGKQATVPTTALISGLVRKKGYSRGADGKVLYTISGSSTGIRLNEWIIYAVSEAAKTASGAIDLTDATRKADTLLASNLTTLAVDGVLSTAGLAANSDVETFMASLSIEFGELQDLVNYIEDQSGGEVVVDTNDLVNFRHEIKNTFFGRGFTLKNKYTGASTDDADDTMYLRGKNWSYEDDFYKSANYSNRVHALLPAETVPSTREELGYTSPNNFVFGTTTVEFAFRFRPTHSHFLPGDIMIVGSEMTTSGSVDPWVTRMRIVGPNAIGSTTPNNLPVLVNIDFLKTNFASPVPINADEAGFTVLQEQIFYDGSNVKINSFDLDTTKDYWLIISNDNLPTNNQRFYWARKTTTANNISSNNSGASLSTNATAGTTWTAIPTDNHFCLSLPRRRSLAFKIWDPKGIQAVQSGLTFGMYVDSMLSDVSARITNRDSMYRHISNQLYNMVRPRTSYNFPRVLAPNIPPVPGDPIVISDSVLGLSTSGNQVTLTTCGDMTYTWGEMERGNYEAPTILNIQAIGVHSRYR